MESVLAATLMIFLNLFAVLTLASTFISSQQAYQAGLQALEARLNEQARTSLQEINAKTISGGSGIQIIYKNNGSEKVANFKNWDVIVQYYDTSTPSKTYTTWIPYAEKNPSNNQWTVTGIYADAKRGIMEAYDPGILNPGEELMVEVLLPHTIALESQVQVTLTVKNGANLSTIFIRNTPPVLVNNTGITIAPAKSELINEMILKTTDVDNDATELVYTVTTPPAQGTLNLGATFTEFDLMKDHLRYTHTGTGSDSFVFTVSDGQDVIGPYTMNITVSEPPTLAMNAGLTLPINTNAAITTAMLNTTDVDNSADQLIYTIVGLPPQGSLSKTTFTQADIDNGDFQYTHVAAGPDSFTFKVSDGTSEIGPFTFAIAVN
jgi:archaellum component FlaF (FlaF/FlaG flagellin family)